MNEQPFTNREIGLMFAEIKHELVEMKEDGKEIKTQTQKTNGRVTDLEKTSAAHDTGFRIAAYIGIPILSIVVSVIGWMLLQIISIPQQIQAALIPFTH